MNSLDLDTIKDLLAGEKKREDEKYERTAQHHLWHIHGFDRKFTYLFELPYECMFTPWKSNLVGDNPYWFCIGCGAMVKDRESHYNWHKGELNV